MVGEQHTRKIKVGQGMEKRWENWDKRCRGTSQAYFRIFPESTKHARDGEGQNKVRGQKKRDL